MKYPEHEKLQKVRRDSEAIGQFLDSPDKGFTRMVWHDSHTEPDKYVYLPCEDECKLVERGWYNPEGWYPDHRSINQVLAEYFEIDLDKLEAEKREMLDEFRAKTAS